MIRNRKYARMARNIKTDAKTVYFESFGGISFSDSPKAVFRVMCEDSRFSDWQFIWVFRDLSIERDALLNERATLVKWGTKEHIKAYAEAKYWFLCNRVPEYVYPKDDQVYIQCWHGTPLKRLGCDVKIDAKSLLNTSQEWSWRYKVDSAKWSYLVSPSGYTTEKLMSAFGVLSERREKRALEVGYPRNDAIVNDAGDEEKIYELKKALGLPRDKSVLLYAPTYRDDNFSVAKGYVQHIPLDVGMLYNSFGEDWVILIRSHYHAENSTSFEGYEEFIRDVSDYEDINDLYLLSDALMTDYSSVFFDYANTNKPFIFFWSDIKHYEDNVRGFYLDPSGLPGAKCVSTEDVVMALKNIKSDYADSRNEYQRFKESFCPLDDGNAAKRLTEKIFFAIV
jgi:CDP-glycerol glycerophosphotransferase